MSSKVYVKDTLQNEILMETTMENIEKAYLFAKEMEEVGLEVEVIAPSVHQTLAHSLGATKEQLDEYMQGLDDELNDHDGINSCCFTDEKTQ